MAKKQKPLDNLKYEVAREMGIDLHKVSTGGLTSRQYGYIGGYMVKKLIEQAKKNNQ